MNDLSHSLTNILFITLDSCRYDSAKLASTPNIDRIGILNRAETSATFTYPAHHAFFIGNLPRLLESEYYFKEYTQIWRSGNARESMKNVFIHYEGKNILDFYKSQKFNIQGFGGVSFFNTYKKTNTLPELFENFNYFGPANQIPIEKKAPRNLDHLTLSHIDEISQAFTKDKSFMVFVNANETHIPYDTPNTKVNSEYIKALTKLYQEHYSQQFYDISNLPLSQNEINMLKKAQIEALEWCDGQIGKLINRIPSSKPTLVIICGDHGDEFGEGGRFGHSHSHQTVMEVPFWAGIIEN